MRVRVPVGEGYYSLGEVAAQLGPDAAEVRKQNGLGPPEFTDSSVGAGASGPAVEIAFEVARGVVDDMGRLASLGGWLLWLSDRIKTKRNGGLSLPDSVGGVALGSVAAAHAAHFVSLDGYRFIGTRPLEGDGSSGSDDRFIWAATFRNEQRGDALVVFVSDLGVYLGHVFVPFVWHFDGHDGVSRTPEQCISYFQQRNRKKKKK